MSRPLNISVPEGVSLRDPALVQCGGITGFNQAMPANAGCLWDDRSHSGHWLRAVCATDNPTDSNAGYTLGLEANFRFPQAFASTVR